MRSSLVARRKLLAPQSRPHRALAQLARVPVLITGSRKAAYGVAGSAAAFTAGFLASTASCRPIALTAAKLRQPSRSGENVRSHLL